jgi:hypothetical protein
MLEACVLGVRAFPLVDRVVEYRDHFADVIAWRRILSEQDPDVIAAASRQFVSDVHGRKYCYDPRRMFSSRHGDSEGATKVEASYYCSELVCAFWQRCGLMQAGCQPASFWPGDLAEGGQSERWLADGVTLAPEVVLSSGPLPPPPPPRMPPPRPPQQPKAPSQGAVLRHGYLEKLPVSSSIGKWQRRWIVLSANRIEWSLSATEEADPCGLMWLSGQSEATLDDPLRPNALHVRSFPGGPRLTLRAPASSAAEGGSASAESKARLLLEWHAAVAAATCEAARAAQKGGGATRGAAEGGGEMVSRTSTRTPPGRWSIMGERVEEGGEQQQQQQQQEGEEHPPAPSAVGIDAAARVQQPEEAPHGLRATPCNPNSSTTSGSPPPTMYYNPATATFIERSSPLDPPRGAVQLHVGA